jgi:hypothetical protein
LNEEIRLGISAGSKAAGWKTVAEKRKRFQAQITLQWQKHNT